MNRYCSVLLLSLLSAGVCADRLFVLGAAELVGFSVGVDEEEDVAGFEAVLAKSRLRRA